MQSTDFTIDQLENGNYVVKAQGIYQDIDFVNGGFITTQERAQEIIDILVQNSTPTLETTQNVKIQELKDAYAQALASGFQATIGGTEYTFGWTTDDKSNILLTQQGIDDGFITFPFYYADVVGHPVTITSQDDFNIIKAKAASFFNAQHQQILSLIGQVKSTTAPDDINKIQWTLAAY